MNTNKYLKSVAQFLEAAAGITWDGDENMNQAGYLKRIDEASAVLPRVVHKSAARIEHTGTLTETILLRIPFAGGSLGVNGFIEVDVISSCTANANTKYLLFYLVAKNAIPGLVADGGSDADRLGIIANAGSDNSYRGVLLIGNRAAASQVSHLTMVQNTSGSGTFDTFVNTANDFDLVVTGDLAVATDVVAIEAIKVTLTP